MLGAVRVGMVDGKLIANPAYDEARDSTLNIVVAGTEDGIVMVEAGAHQVSEDEVVEAIEFGHECCKKIIAGIRELVAQGRQDEARLHAAADRSGVVRTRSKSRFRADLTDAMNTEKYAKIESYHKIDELQEEADRQLSPKRQQAEAGSSSTV